LSGLPAAILDLDVGQYGSSVAVCGQPRSPTHIAFDGATAPLRVACRYPIVRALDDERAVLVDARTTPGERNGWIVRSDGTIEHEFRAGDAVNDVIVCDEYFVMAYFDEALRASDRLWGVVLLDRAGGLELSYNDSFGGDVVDCYCACDAGCGRVLFLGYPGFSAVLLDVTKKQQRNWTAPTLVHGASAVTVAGDTAFFFGSYEDRHRLARWRLGDANAEQIGTTTGPLRGLRGGRMLSKGTADYTVLSFDEFA
jgi:hypothetical protein